MKVDLAGQVAFVTGAAGAIGGAIARAYAANGAHVVVADIDGAGAHRMADSLPGGSSTHMAVTVDIRDETAIEAAFGAVSERFGRLDILVNNAGVNTMAHRVTLEAFPTHEWDRIVDIDLKGLFLVSRAGVKPMLAAGRGRVVNVASIVGLVPLRLQSPFVAAKAGVVHLTRSMALELGGRGVLVNGIAPGSTLTEGTRQLFYSADGQFSANAQRMLAQVALGRPGTVEEIAAGALFLADPETTFVNGHVLTIDGGWTAGAML